MQPLTMQQFGVVVGETVRFSKTIGESDVYLFAGISGDFFPNHVNEEFMKQRGFGRRIAHGVLILALSSTTSSMISSRSLEKADDYFPVSLGYDHVRFLKPVFIGDTVTVQYTVEELDPARHRSLAKIEAFNQSGELVMVAQHIMKWVPKPAAP